MMVLADDVDTFDRFSRAYDLLMPRAKPGQLRAGIALAKRPVETGIDLAGGTGRAARAIPEIDWFVVDAATGTLSIARKHDLTPVAGDATRLPIAADSVDAVVMVDALHHVRRPERVANEARRVLRSGGVFVVREIDPERLAGRVVQIGERIVGFDSKFYSIGSLSATLECEGFTVEEVDRDWLGYTIAATADSELSPSHEIG